MKRITVSVDKDIDLFFRKFASQKFKFERGWYSKAVVEAMELWIEKTRYENENLYRNCDSGPELWKKIKDDKTNDMLDIMDHIINYFTKDAVYAEEIKYTIKDDFIEIFPKNTQRENIVKLIDVKNGDVNFNCPITLTLEAALEDLTGEHYSVVSSELQNHSKPILNSFYAIHSKI